MKATQIMFVLCALLCSSKVMAVQSDEVLPNPALEARARTISQELRCLVCQNQSIDDSAAPLARDLRLLVREQLKTGRTDREVINFLVDRYGEFVLLRPPFDQQTVLLWLGPFAVLLIGASAILARVWRTRREAGTESSSASEPALTPEEKQRLLRLSELYGK